MNDYNTFYSVKKPVHIPSLVLGIVAIASLWFTFGVSGLVCGIIGINLAQKRKFEYNSNPGFVLNIVSLSISIIFLIIVVLCLFVIFLMPDSIGAYYIRDIFKIY